MPKILVHTPFNLLLDTTSAHVRFETGVHDVDHETAEHWYAKQHSTPVVAERAKRAAAAPKAEAPALVSEKVEEPKVEAEAETGPKKPIPPAPLSAEDQAERTAIRAKLTELGAKLPHHAAGLVKHRAALADATKSA